VKLVPIIELDLLIAFINRTDKLHDIATNIFKMIIDGALENVAVPVSAYLEYELILKSRGYSEDFIRTDLEAFKNLENLGIIPLTLDIIIRASRLRREYGLSYFDSLHAASALYHDGKIISRDEAYDRVVGLERIDPKTIIEDSLVFAQR